MPNSATKLILLLFFLTISGCASISAEQEENLYLPIKSFSIDDPITYDNTPFGPVIDKTFDTIRPIQNAYADAPHYVNILNMGDESLLARIHLFRIAKKTINIQTFIWQNDESGRYIMKELIAAAQRGVKVRLLIDYMGMTNDVDLISYFLSLSPNIEIKFYNPSSDTINASAIQLIGEAALKFKKLNQRMHNKIIIIDDRVFITGGRNIENDYFDRSPTRNFKDRDVLVVGPLTKAVTKSFEKYWFFKQSIKAEDLVDIQHALGQKQYLNRVTPADFNFGDLFSDIDKNASDPDFIKTNITDKSFRISKIMFTTDEPGKNLSARVKGAEGIDRQLGKILAEAKKSIIVQTPYLVFDPYSLKAVKRFRKKNKALDIILSTNSLAATDHITAYAAAFRQKKIFIKDLRIRIFEFKPIPGDIKEMMPNFALHKPDFYPAEPQGILNGLLDTLNFAPKDRHMCIHAKSFIADDNVSWVGSFNFDPRSFHLNTEAGVAIWDEDFTAALKKDILRDIAPENSWVVGINKVPLIQPINELLTTLSMQIPVADVWPFRYSSLFELKEGKEPVPFFHKDFYKNYRDIGFFPGIPLNPQEIRLRLFKTFIKVAEPII